MSMKILPENVTNSDVQADITSLQNDPKHIFVEWTVSADTTTSSSYEDIAGVANVEITIPVTRTYLMRLDVINWYITGTVAGSTVQFAAYLDNTTDIEYLPRSVATASDRRAISEAKEVVLTAGTHNIRVRWRRGGTGVPTFNTGITEKIQIVII